MKATMKKAAKGFTLIELAVVIAIIAILAAIAIPRFGNTTAAAEQAMAQDMLSQLSSASAIFTAENATVPTQFTQFVTVDALAANDGMTLSLQNFGTDAKNGTRCNVGANQIDCSGTFPKLTTATYNIDAQGVITANIVKAQ